MDKDVRIAVVGHKPQKNRLPSQYLYLTRKSETKLFPDLSTSHDFRAPSYVWSEYAAWFENSSEFKKYTTNGLFHYRCVLNFGRVRLDLLPIVLRRGFLKYQTILISKQKRFFLAVGEPNNLGVSAWREFVSAHPESEHILKLACEYYDKVQHRELFDSENRLKGNKSYFPRNIFVTNSDFGIKWLQLSFDIAVDLDSKLDTYPDNRWGGFVLERIFTLYVEDYVKENNLVLITAQQSYFADNLDWIKVMLLKLNIINFLNRRRKLLNKLD